MTWARPWRQIFRLIGRAAAELRPEEPIDLPEANENTVPTGTIPLKFGPAPAQGIHHASVIIELTPDEFQKIQCNEIHLPDGWIIRELVPRSLESVGGMSAPNE